MTDLQTQPDLHIVMVANQPIRTGKYKIRCRAEKWLKAHEAFEFHKTIPGLILHNIDYDKEAKAISGYTGPDRYVPYTILFIGKRSEAERFAGGMQMFYIGSNCVHANDSELPVI